MKFNIKKNPNNVLNINSVPPYPATQGVLRSILKIIGGRIVYLNDAFFLYSALQVLEISYILLFLYLFCPYFFTKKTINCFFSKKNIICHLMANFLIWLSTSFNKLRSYLSSFLTKSFFFSIQGTLISILSNCLLVFLGLICLCFFFNTEGVDSLLLTRWTLRLFLITLVLLYFIKHWRLVSLLVFSKARYKHVKSLVLPFRRKRYIELKKSIKMVFFLFIIQLSSVVYNFQDFNLWILYTVVLLFFWVVYMGWVGKVVNEGTSPKHFIKSSLGDVIPNRVEKSLVVYKRSDFLARIQKRLLLTSYNNLLPSNRRYINPIHIEKSLVVYKRSDFLVHIQKRLLLTSYNNLLLSNRRHIHISSRLRMPLGVGDSFVLSSVLGEVDPKPLSPEVECEVMGDLLRRDDLDNEDEGNILDDFADMVALNDYRSSHLGRGNYMAFHKQLNELKYEFERLERKDDIDRWSYLLRRIQKLERMFAESDRNLVFKQNNIRDVNKFGNIKEITELTFCKTNYDLIQEAREQNKMSLLVYKNMNTMHKFVEKAGSGARGFEAMLSLLKKL